jgi:hypothetical protein
MSNHAWFKHCFDKSSTRNPSSLLGRLPIDGLSSPIIVLRTLATSSVLDASLKLQVLLSLMCYRNWIFVVLMSKFILATASPTDIYYTRLHGLPLDTVYILYTCTRHWLWLHRYCVWIHPHGTVLTTALLLIGYTVLTTSLVTHRQYQCAIISGTDLLSSMDILAARYRPPPVFIYRHICVFCPCVPPLHMTFTSRLYFFRVTLSLLFILDFHGHTSQLTWRSTSRKPFPTGLLVVPNFRFESKLHCLFPL